MNLIIFLLVMQAVLVSVGMIDVTAPSYAAVAARATLGTRTTKSLDLPWASASRKTASTSPRTAACSPRAEDAPTEGEEADPPEDLREPADHAPAPTAPTTSRPWPEAAHHQERVPDTMAIYMAADKDIPYKLIVEHARHIP